MANFPASLLILNGKSADNQPLREAITLLRDEGIQIHVRVTWEKGDAQRYVDEARRLGVETVIAGGGDGTINEVSTALIQIRDGVAPALGLLPLGTANDFATSAGIPEALDKALKLAIAGNAMEIDMARSMIKPVLSIWRRAVLAPALPPKRRKNLKPRWAASPILFTV